MDDTVDVTLREHLRWYATRSAVLSGGAAGKDSGVVDERAVVPGVQLVTAL